MKLKPMGRAVKASMLSLALALGATACSNDYTVSYVYMTSAKTLPHGLINGYQVDYQSGLLRPLPDSPIDAGGRDTVGLVVAPSQLFLYTVNNFDSDVTEFAVGTDGKLYPQNTYNITGSLPTAAAIDAAGKFLYVTFTYQNNPPSPGYPNGSELYTPANPGPGGITIFPIASDNSLCGANATTLNPKLCTQNAITVNVGRNPMAIVTSKVGNFVYVLEQDSAVTANLLAFSENPSSGALTSLAGVTINAGNVASTGFATGPNPSGIIENATSTNLYITDQTLNQLAWYSVGTNGIPNLLGTVQTDAGPMGMSFDLNGQYLYVAAYTANALDGFNIGANGQPVRSTVAGTVQTGTGPTCVTVSGSPSDANPIHAVYLYTSNALSNNLTGEQLNEKDGSLDQILGMPFSGSALPTCAVTAPAYPLRNY